MKSGLKCRCASSYIRSKTGKCKKKQKKIAHFSCSWPKVKSKGGRSCKCAPGYRRNKHNSGCKKIPKQRETIDVAHIQQCLTKAGYQPGTVDGKSGKKTRSAFRAFQIDNRLRSRALRLNDTVSQKRLFGLCAKSRSPKIRTVKNSAVVIPTLARVSYPGKKCLSPDLLALVEENYGKRPGLKACTNECLPKPSGLLEREADLLSQKHGVKWCADCIRLGSYLPIKDILKLERASNLSICAALPKTNQCQASGKSNSKVYKSVRTIFRTLPATIDNSGDIAVIIGNTNYSNNLPINQNAHQDADAVYTLLSEQLGYDKKHIIDLRDTTKADLDKVFGSKSNPNGTLSRLVKEQGNGEIFIYVSGHGLTAQKLSKAGDVAEDGVSEAGGNNDSKLESYLLPVDAQFSDLPGSSYPLSVLYENLSKIKARSIMLLLEANFGERLYSKVTEPNLPENSVNVMPNKPVTGLSVFKASDQDQKTLEDPEFGIGLFTRYMIEGLGGGADNDVYGRLDGQIDTVELHVFTSSKVRTTARKSFGVEQKPVLFKVENQVIGRLSQ